MAGRVAFTLMLSEQEKARAEHIRKARRGEPSSAQVFREAIAIGLDALEKQVRHDPAGDPMQAAG